MSFQNWLHHKCREVYFLLEAHRLSSLSLCSHKTVAALSQDQISKGKFKEKKTSSLVCFTPAFSFSSSSSLKILLRDYYSFFLNEFSVLETVCLSKEELHIRLSYLRETELVNTRSDASFCCSHVLRVIWSFKQQGLFVLDSHTTLKEKQNRLKYSFRVLKAFILEETKMLTLMSYLLFPSGSLRVSKWSDAQENLHPLGGPFIAALRFHCYFLNTQASL